MDVEEAIADFQERIKNYELAYESLDNKKDKYRKIHRCTLACMHTQCVWLYMYIVCCVFVQGVELGEDLQCGRQIRGQQNRRYSTVARKEVLYAQ